jgi:hypothetical protein
VSLPAEIRSFLKLFQGFKSLAEGRKKLFRHAETTSLLVVMILIGAILHQTALEARPGTRPDRDPAPADASTIC